FLTGGARLILGGRGGSPAPLGSVAVGYAEVGENVEGAHLLARAVAIAPEGPQIAAGVGPADCAVSRSGNVARSGRAFGAVGPELVDRAGPAHPGPLAAYAADLDIGDIAERRPGTIGSDKAGLACRLSEDL